MDTQRYHLLVTDLHRATITVHDVFAGGIPSEHVDTMLSWLSLSIRDGADGMGAKMFPNALFDAQTHILGGVLYVRNPAAPTAGYTVQRITVDHADALIDARCATVERWVGVGAD